MGNDKTVLSEEDAGPGFWEAFTAPIQPSSASTKVTHPKVCEQHLQRLEHDLFHISLTPTLIWAGKPDMVVYIYNPSSGGMGI